MIISEPAHGKTYNKTNASSEYSAVEGTCVQRRLRSACASAQSDQNFRLSIVPSTASGLSKEG